MPNDDSLVTKRLLSPTKSDKACIENEKMENNANNPEADLRLHDLMYDTEIVQEIEDLLAENENLVFERDEDLLTPLHALAFSGPDNASEIAKLLLGVTESSDGRVIEIKRGALLHLRDSRGFCPLTYAARNLLPILVRSLLEFGARPSEQDVNGESALHFIAEGNSSNALECAKEILKYDEDGFLINLKNNSELMPLHKAVKNQAVDMVELLLQTQYKLDLSIHVNKLGQTILHYICLQPAETEKACKMFQSIVKRCNAAQLNHADNKGLTVLHTAAIEKLPEIMKILVTDPRTDVLKVCKRSRLALHYSAENGSYPNGYRCVESLISRKFTEATPLIQYLYRMEDDQMMDPFMYTCLNCPIPTIQKYLSIIPEPQFWMTATHMSLIYKQSPAAIKALMDGAFSEQKKTTDVEHDIIYTDFGPITGYVDPIEKSPQQESKYLKQSLWWDFDSQKEILMHPLVQLFVVRKCQKLQTIICGWILWQIIWLLAYTALVLSVYNRGIQSKPVAVVSSLIMIVYAVISLINEIFEAFSVGLAYFISFTNFIQLVQIILAFLAISPVLLGYETPEPWNKYSASVGILLACILSMKDIGKMSEQVGLVVEVLKQVVIQILKVLLICSPLIVGFTLAFTILFDDEESLNTTFPGPLVKVLVMMTGEFEYNDTFKAEEGNTSTIRTIRLIFFLSFLIAVPIAFFNCLIAFSLDKMLELRERAKVGKISKQLEHIYFIESILLSLSPLKKVCSHETVVRLLRRRNVTSAMIDGELRFETLLKENMQKKLDRRTFKEKRLEFWKHAIPICGTELPSDVRNQIFVLASANTNNQKNAACVCTCTCSKCI